MISSTLLLYRNRLLLIINYLSHRVVLSLFHKLLTSSPLHPDFRSISRNLNSEPIKAITGITFTLVLISHSANPLILLLVLSYYQLSQPYPPLKNGLRSAPNLTPPLVLFWGIFQTSIIRGFFPEVLFQKSGGAGGIFVAPSPLSCQNVPLRRPAW